MAMPYKAESNILDVFLIFKIFKPFEATVQLYRYPGSTKGSNYGGTVLNRI